MNTARLVLNILYIIIIIASHILLHIYILTVNIKKKRNVLNIINNYFIVDHVTYIYYIILYDIIIYY